MFQKDKVYSIGPIANGALRVDGDETADPGAEPGGDRRMSDLRCAIEDMSSGEPTRITVGLSGFSSG